MDDHQEYKLCAASANQYQRMALMQSINKKFTHPSSNVLEGSVCNKNMNRIMHFEDY